MKFKTICLSMIVKNESKIIVRMLDSVINFIDTYCICDTGSTDATVQIIQEYFKSKNMSGKIVFKKFENFASNRNFALEECNGMSDYILLMDADMVLKTNNFDKNVLTLPLSFKIVQGDKNTQWQNIRIVVNDSTNKYFGTTHEYIVTQHQTLLLNKDNIFIEDIGDGGSKEDKFYRDIELLEKGIQEEPSNCRYYFYLANSYYATAKFPDAIAMYKKRIELGGWDQELWYSYYKMGECYAMTESFKDALECWLTCYNILPNRIENLYHIMKYYNSKNMYNLALLYYNIAKSIISKLTPEEKVSHLFLENNIYTHKLFLEYLTIARHLGGNVTSGEIFDCLNNLAINEIDNLSNLKYYIACPQFVKNVILVNKYERRPRLLYNDVALLSDHMLISEVSTKLDNTITFSQIFASKQKQLLAEVIVCYDGEKTSSTLKFSSTPNTINNMIYCKYIKFNNQLCVIKKFNPITLYKISNLDDEFINIPTPNFFQFVTDYIYVKDGDDKIIFILKLSFGNLTYHLFCEIDEQTAELSYSNLFYLEDSLDTECLGAIIDNNNFTIIYKTSNLLKMGVIDLKSVREKLILN